MNDPNHRYYTRPCAPIWYRKCVSYFLNLFSRGIHLYYILFNFHCHLISPSIHSYRSTWTTTDHLLFSILLPYSPGCHRSCHPLQWWNHFNHTCGTSPTSVGSPSLKILLHCKNGALHFRQFLLYFHIYQILLSCCCCHTLLSSRSDHTASQSTGA